MQLITAQHKLCNILSSFQQARKFPDLW